MLFFPGAISQFFATVLFFVLIVGGGYAGVRIWYQKERIEHLEKKVTQYEQMISTIDQKEAFYKKNLEILKKSCNRTAKPAVKGGKLDVENLFDKEPM